jgi:hypothetical protein
MALRRVAVRVQIGACGTVVVTTYNCEIVLGAHGFYVRCTARDCTYVTEYTSSKSVARRWANAHDEDQPNDGLDQHRSDAQSGMDIDERTRSLT